MPLKLKARDAEDIQVVSAILQDAVVPAHDMAYDAAEKRFVMAVSRFCWEKHKEGQAKDAVHERVNCAVTVKGVTGIKCRDFDLNAKSKIHELLALMLEDNALSLVFAGGARLRLELVNQEGNNWEMKLEDFGETWPTSCCPDHGGGS